VHCSSTAAAVGFVAGGVVFVCVCATSASVVTDPASFGSFLFSELVVFVFLFGHPHLPYGGGRWFCVVFVFFAGAL
jgi:hypothetical protein